MLGFQMVRNLVIGVGTIGAFKSTPGIDLPAFWRYSLNTACAARWLARAAGEDADLAFTLGLVHGLGHLVLHSALPAQMQQLDSDLPPLALGRAAAERALLGYHHGQVSAELALRWNFPAEVAATLRQVPDPLGTEPPPALAAWVHVAAWRARVQHFRWDAGQAQSSCPVAVGQALRRPFRWLAEEATLCGADPAALPVMPPLATLTDGLEAMLV
jgi:HD-like signal output (HDOD) protein